MQRRPPAVTLGATAWPKAPFIAWDGYEDLALPPPPPWLQQLAHQVEEEREAAADRPRIAPPVVASVAVTPVASAASAVTQESPTAVSQPGE